MPFIKKFYVNTTTEVDCLPITTEVRYAIRDSKNTDGLVTVLVTRSGAGIVLVPNVPEALVELKNTMDVFGSEAGLAKDKLKRDRELGPIIQSSLLGRMIHMPFQNSALLTDPYDDIFLVDFEKKAQRREVIVQVFAEAAPAPEPKKAPARR